MYCGGIEVRDGVWRSAEKTPAALKKHLEELHGTAITLELTTRLGKPTEHLIQRLDGNRIMATLCKQEGIPLWMLGYAPATQPGPATSWTELICSAYTSALARCELDANTVAQRIERIHAILIPPEFTPFSTQDTLLSSWLKLFYGGARYLALFEGALGLSDTEIFPAGRIIPRPSQLTPNEDDASPVSESGLDTISQQFIADEMHIDRPSTSFHHQDDASQVSSGLVPNRLLVDDSIDRPSNTSLVSSDESSDQLRETEVGVSYSPGMPQDDAFSDLSTLSATPTPPPPDIKEGLDFDLDAFERHYISRKCPHFRLLARLVPDIRDELERLGRPLQTSRTEHMDIVLWQESHLDALKTIQSQTDLLRWLVHAHCHVVCRPNPCTGICRGPKRTGCTAFRARPAKMVLEGLGLCIPPGCNYSDGTITHPLLKEAFERIRRHQAETHRGHHGHDPKNPKRYKKTKICTVFAQLSSAVFAVLLPAPPIQTMGQSDYTVDRALVVILILINTTQTAIESAATYSTLLSKTEDYRLYQDTWVARFEPGTTFVMQLSGVHGTGSWTNTAVTDVAIAWVLTTKFTNMSGDAGGRQTLTTGVTRGWAWLTIENGSVTVCAGLTNVILYLAANQTPYHLLPQLSTAGIRSIYVVMVLICREAYRILDLNNSVHRRHLSAGKYASFEKSVP
ncbi:hypothetical protein C8R43DRAFT_946854 [Mycena crocata]|nr:hypothetical protein C8R43DRAFT_946854 [Mycena crocata]